MHSAHNGQLHEHQPTVLVVEDEEAVRNLIVQVLSTEGYLVLTAGTAHDALRLLNAPPSPIDVALLDVRLPDGSGVELCSHLRQLYPEMPVIVCTGDVNADEGAELLRLGVHRYFRKPFTVDELLAVVEAALP
jgi:DNA-binding response OmpR family regulator